MPEAKELVALRASLGLLRNGSGRAEAGTPVQTNRVRHASPAGTSATEVRKADAGAVPDRRSETPVRAAQPSRAEARLLALLDQPRRGTELPDLLGVTRERVRQLLVGLSKKDLIRSAELDRPTSVVARKNDLSLLLRHDQERVLSRFPESGATTLRKIAALVRIPAAGVGSIAGTLCEAGLIETAGMMEGAALYRLTKAGASHWQRSSTVCRAKAAPPVPLPFRSDRVHDVLRYIQTQGAANAKAITGALAVPYSSLNALMQYLKRRGMIRNASAAGRAAYVLTVDGERTLAAMQQCTGDSPPS